MRENVKPAVLCSSTPWLVLPSGHSSPPPLGVQDSTRDVSATSQTTVWGFMHVGAGNLNIFRTDVLFWVSQFIIF